MFNFRGRVNCLNIFKDELLEAGRDFPIVDVYMEYRARPRYRLHTMKGLEDDDNISFWSGNPGSSCDYGMSSQGSTDSGSSFEYG